jgi:hypothetical protein
MSKGVSLGVNGMSLMLVLEIVGVKAAALIISSANGTV